MLQAIGAERAVLAILMKQPDSLFLVDDVLSVEDFTNTGNQLIYGLMRDIIIDDPEVKLDQYILISKAEEQGMSDFLTATQNGELIEALDSTKDSMNPASIGKHVMAIKTASIKRTMIGTFDYLKDDIENFQGTPIELQNMIEDKVHKTINYLDSGGDDIEDLTESFEEAIEDFADGNFVQSVDIGFPRWQRDCGGIRNGTVTGIFARAKAGKSQIAAYAGMKVAIEGNKLHGKLPVLYLDSELQLRDQQMRIGGMMTGISYERIESGAWKSKPDEIALLKDAFEEIKGAPFYYKNIAGRSISHVIPVIRKFVQKYVTRGEGQTPKCLIIYDYIKLMSAKDLKNAAEWQMLGFLICALHDLAVQLNIPILVFGQLNREALKVDSVATIGGSDRISHNLDSLTLFRKKRPEEIELDGTQRGNHLMKVALARRGPGNDYDDWINFHFDKGSGQFKEDKRNSEITESIQTLREVRDRLNEEETQSFGEARE